MDVYRLLTEVLCRKGRVDEASELAKVAFRDLSKKNPYASAAQRLAEARVAVTQGDLAVASKCYEHAIASLEQLDLPLEVSLARLAYGRALRELGDGGRARAAQACA